METILNVDNIKKQYGNKGSITKAVDGIKFTVEKGEFIGIMGASGSGKSTLLNCISTIDTVTSGEIYIDNKNITALNSKELSDFRAEKLGFIFQDFNLLDTLTAYENIALTLSIQSLPTKQIESNVMSIAQKLNIKEILEKYPYEMSGGQQQRVAAARAMVNYPALLLADEPTGALDSKSAKTLLSLLGNLNNKFGATILMVTHDSLTASYCKRILFIKDGKIYEELLREDLQRKDFFNKIMEVVSDIGGGIDDDAQNDLQ